MGPELEQPKGRSEVISEAFPSKENGGAAIDSKDNYPKCVSTYEGCTLEMDASIDEPLAPCRSNEVEVNITECTHSGGNGLVKAEFEEATECSSSFDDTDSGISNAANLSESEVMSDFHGDSSSKLGIDGFGDVFGMRKKKLTSHWRTFIQPLMWRCKWVELQIKKFDAQAQKYYRDLADYNHRKHWRSENFKLEGFGVKSIPFPNDGARDKVLKRKKRRSTESTMNVASYMSHHNLFSYYENRIRTGDAACVKEDWMNQVNSADRKGNDESELDDESMWLQSMDGDDLMEEMYRKIEILQSQVRNLKTRLDKVMSENAGKFSLADNLDLLVPPNGLASSARSLASPPKDGVRMPIGSSNIASQLVSQYNPGNVAVPESAVSSYGEVSYLPNVIKCTDQSRLGNIRFKPEDEVLIYNERLKEEINSFDEVSLQPVRSPQVAETNAAVAHAESNSPNDFVDPEQPTDGQPAPKIRSISKLTAPKSRKKRGRRKAGSGRWSRRSSG